MGHGASKQSKVKNIKTLSKETKLSKVEITDLYRVFSEIAPEGWVDRVRFKNALEILESHGLNPHLRDLSSDKIFELLDINKDNKVDFKEFISGFALLCKGSTEDKIRISFEVFDKDGSKSISRDELYEFCYMAWTSAFRTLLASHSEVEIGPEEVQNFCKESATNFVNQVFDEIDVNHDGELSYEEFKQFALQDPKITAGLLHFEEEVQLLL